MSNLSKTTINLDSDFKKELKILAIKEDISLSGLIIKMINEGYKRRTEEEKPAEEKNVNKPFGQDNVVNSLKRNI